MHSPVERFEQQYKAAAGEGAIVELKMRLLADKIPALQKLAHDQKLEDVELLIAKHFPNDLSADETETLKRCRQLRNKILHCDFRAARTKLNELGVETERGDVKRVDIRGISSPAQLVETIARVKANIPGSFEYIGDGPFIAGSVFGWLIELGNAGDFVRAAECFAGATRIIDRLAMLS